jgi:AcrR family transcriptional regulator
MFERQDLDRRTKRHQRSRREIIDAAWELARDEGIGGFSLRRLASRVGMKAPSLYQYFATKNDLYDAMFHDGYQQLQERLASQEGLAPLTREEIKVEGRKFFDFCTEDPVRYALMCERPIPGFEPSEQSAALAQDVLRTQVYSMMANLGIKDEETVRLFLGITNGIVSQQNALNPGGRDWRPLMDRGIDLFLDHVGVP